MYVFDLDGTLADIEHRRPLVEKKSRTGNAPQWSAFFAACVDDKPIAPVVNLFRTLHRAGVTLEIWSGRSDEVYWETVTWLHNNVFARTTGWNDPEHYRYVRLLMRPKGDTRPDVELKEQFLDLTLKEGLTIELVVDDRQKVVDMWRRRGIVCLQCAKGDY